MDVANTKKIRLWEGFNATIDPTEKIKRKEIQRAPWRRALYEEIIMESRLRRAKKYAPWRTGSDVKGRISQFSVTVRRRESYCNALSAETVEESVQTKG